MYKSSYNIIYHCSAIDPKLVDSISDEALNDMEAQSRDKISRQPDGQSFTGEVAKKSWLKGQSYD